MARKRIVMLDLKAFEAEIRRNTFSRQAVEAIEKHIASRHRPTKRTGRVRRREDNYSG